MNLKYDVWNFYLFVFRTENVKKEKIVPELCMRFTASILSLPVFLYTKYILISFTLKVETHIFPQLFHIMVAK